MSTACSRILVVTEAVSRAQPPKAIPNKWNAKRRNRSPTGEQAHRKQALEQSGQGCWVCSIPITSPTD